MVETVYNYNLFKNIKSLEIKVKKLKSISKTGRINRRIRDLEKQIKIFKRF